MFGNRQLCLIVEDTVEHVGRIADRGWDWLATILRGLIRGPRIECQSRAKAVVTRDRGRSANERLPENVVIGGGERAATPETGQWMTVMVVDDARDRWLKRFFAQITSGTPGELPVRQVR